MIFDSRYGNTEKIARSIEAGIREAGVETECLNARDVKVDSLKENDLICIGAPTEGFTASKPIKDFIAKLGGLSCRESVASPSIQSWIGAFPAARPSSSRKSLSGSGFAFSPRASRR